VAEQEQSPSTATPESSAPISKDGWKRAKQHKVTLPSGAVVKIELPDLARMIKGGQVPNELLDVATRVGAGSANAADDTPEKKRELLGQAAEFNAFLVEQTVVEPSVTKEEVLADDLPAEDVDLLVQFALRKTDFDAVGKHLGGLETVDSFRRFRGLDLSIENILGSQGG
jgi:hypothetical protein